MPLPEPKRKYEVVVLVIFPQNNELMELEEFLDCIFFYRRTWTAAEGPRKAETNALSLESALVLKESENELQKNRRCICKRSQKRMQRGTRSYNTPRR